MTPDEKQLLTELNERLKRVEQYTTSLGGSLEFKKIIQLYSGENTEFKTIKTSNFGLSKAPVAQQASIADPSGGVTVDSEARTAINSILDVLDAFGFTL